MAKKRIFTHDDQQQKDYAREARLQYGPDLVNESNARWNGYTELQRDAIREEGDEIYNDLADALTAGKDPLSAEVQDMLVRWHDHIRYFYEPTLDILRGLGEMYVMSPDFRATFEKLHPELPEYLQTGIIEYVDDLETEAIRRMLAEDAGDGDADVLRRLSG